MDWLAGALEGAQVQKSVRKLGQLEGLFRDRDAWRSMDPEAVIYSVQRWEPVSPSTQGGLYWGSTTVEPGRVGDEYFMTHGHFHRIRDRAEYYSTVRGRGMLVLMDEHRSIRVEIMAPGSLHYIPGHTAHRAVNTGETSLVFWACWPGDAGHDYEIVAAQGFSGRVLLRDGAPALVPEEPVVDRAKTAE